MAKGLTVSIATVSIRGASTAKAGVFRGVLQRIDTDGSPIGDPKSVDAGVPQLFFPNIEDGDYMVSVSRLEAGTELPFAPAVNTLITVLGDEVTVANLVAIPAGLSFQVATLP